MVVVPVLVTVVVVLVLVLLELLEPLVLLSGSTSEIFRA